MIVLDASAVVDLLLSTERGRQVAEAIADPDETLHAPHLLPVEVASVVRRLALAGQLDPADGDRALHELFQLGISFYDHEPLLAEMFRRRANLTAYDAAYVVLAEALDARLLTGDSRLAAAPGIGVPVLVVDSAPPAAPTDRTRRRPPRTL